MNQNIAKDIRSYIKRRLVNVSKKEFDILQPKLYHWMKRYWNEGLSHKERKVVHQIMKCSGTLPVSWDDWGKKAGFKHDRQRKDITNTK